MSEYIRINAIVARAKADLEISNSNYDLRMQLWADEAIRKMDTLSSYSKFVETLDIVDGRAKLPCGFYKLLGARPVSADGCYCNDLYYIDQVFANNCCTTLCTSILFPECCVDYCAAFEFIDGYIHFHYPTTATQLQMSWLGLLTDDDGLLKIQKKYEIALYNFLCYKVGMSKSYQMDKATRDLYMRTWADESSNIRGSDNENQWHLEKEWIGYTLLNKVKISPKL